MPASSVLSPLGRNISAAPSLTTVYDEARQRFLASDGRGVLRADWLRVVFAHYEVDPAALQSSTPFEIDLHEGRAIVSLVAFHMRRFRFRGTGPLGALALAPVARHSFLNLRTYTRHGGEPAIVLMTEWINNRASVALGPRFYKLPYRFGHLRYEHDLGQGFIRGCARTKHGDFCYRGAIGGGTKCAPALTGTLDEFLLERYTAFTAIQDRRSMFRIWHEPWRTHHIDLTIDDLSLFEEAAPWLRTGRLIAAHYSPGLRDIWIGRPRNAPG
jgi:uncharacterized protein YqjF (DUF2071 family)